LRNLICADIVENVPVACFYPGDFTGTSKLLRRTRSIFHAVLLETISYRARKPVLLHTALFQLLTGLIDRVLQATHLQDHDTLRSSYIKDLAHYMSDFETDSIQLLLNPEGTLGDILNLLNVVTAAAAVGNLSAIKKVLTVPDSTKRRNFFNLLKLASTARIRFFRHPLHAAAVNGKTEVLLYLVKRLYDDYMIWLQTAWPVWLTDAGKECVLLAIYGSLEAAISAGHEDTVAGMTSLVITLLPSSLAVPNTPYLESLKQAAVKSDNLRMWELLRTLSDGTMFSPKRLRLACRADCATLIQDLANETSFNSEANRGLLRNAIRMGSVAVTRVLLSFTPKPKNPENLLHLAIASNKISMLKMLLSHGLQLKTGHVFRIEAFLEKFSPPFLYISGETRILRTQKHRHYPEQLLLKHNHESVPEYEDRKDKVLMALLVGRLVKEADPVGALKWVTPLLDKLRKELDGDAYWQAQMDALAKGLRA
jgi:hypothetical protein